MRKSNTLPETFLFVSKVESKTGKDVVTCLRLTMEQAVAKRKALEGGEEDIFNSGDSFKSIRILPPGTAKVGDLVEYTREDWVPVDYEE